MHWLAGLAYQLPFERTKLLPIDIPVFISIVRSQLLPKLNIPPRPHHNAIPHLHQWPEPNVMAPVLALVDEIDIVER